MRSIFRSTFTDEDIYFREPEAAEISRKLGAACAAFAYLAVCRAGNNSDSIDQ
jgi:hypothetical protein